MSQAVHLYRHFDKKGALLYVGVSLSAVQRLAQLDLETAISKIGAKK